MWELIIIAVILLIVIVSIGCFVYKYGFNDRCSPFIIIALSFVLLVTVLLTCDSYFYIVLLVVLIFVIMSLAYNSVILELCKSSNELCDSVDKLLPSLKS